MWPEKMAASLQLLHVLLLTYSLLNLNFNISAAITISICIPTRNTDEEFLKDFQRSNVDLQYLSLSYALNYVQKIESSSRTSISFPVVVRKYHDKINSMKSWFWQTVQEHCPSRQDGRSLKPLICASSAVTKQRVTEVCARLVLQFIQHA